MLNNLNNLKNQYHADEARAINSYAEAWNIERAFRRIRAEALDDVPSSGCNTKKLRDHFEKHLTCDNPHRIHSTTTPQNSSNHF